MMFFLPIIAEHAWLAPIAHFTTSAFAGGLSYAITTKEVVDAKQRYVFRIFQNRTALAFAIFVGIATHIFFDFLGWF